MFWSSIWLRGPGQRKPSSGIVALVIVLGFASALLGEDSLLFYAPFEGTPEAAIARGGAGGIAGAGLSYEEGVSGKALRVRAEGDFVAYSLPGNFNPERGTLSLWIKPLDFSGGDFPYVPFFRVRDEKNVLVLARFFRTAGIGFGLFHEGESIAQGLAGTPDEIGAGKWVHITVTYRPEEIRLYVDGKLKNVEKSANFFFQTEARQFEVGLFPGGREGLDGEHSGRGLDEFPDPAKAPPLGEGYLLDELAIFGRPLVSAEVSALHEKGPVEFEKMPREYPSDLSITSYPSKGTLVADLLSGVPIRDMTRAEVTVRKQETHQEEIRYPLRVKRDFFERSAIDVKGLSPGMHEIYAEVLEGESLVSKSDVISYEQLEKPDWWENSLAKELKVISPWTPLQVEEGKIRSWGTLNEYLPGKELFPTKIISQGENLLAGPIRIILKRNGKPFWPIGVTFKTVRRGEGETVIRTTANLGPFDVRVLQTTYFDGLMRVEAEFLPEIGGSIDELALEIPIARKHAIHFLYPGRTQGRFPEEAWKSAFRPYIWVGDDDRGLQWFAESDENWRVRQKDREIELVPSSDKVILRFHLVDHPIPVEKAFTITFGLMPTPVKPLRPDWRNWRVASSSALGEEASNPYRANIVLIEPGQWAAPVFSEAPPKVTEEEYAAKLSSGVATYRERGLRVIPYSRASWIGAEYSDGTSTPWYRNYFDEWAILPTIEEKGPTGHLVGVCPRDANYADWWVWEIEKKVVGDYGYDGIFLDKAGVYPCRNNSHGCGYEETGEGEQFLKKSYPVFPQRELFRRISTAFRQVKPEGLLMVSDDGQKGMPCLSFADLEVERLRLPLPAYQDAPRGYLEALELELARALYHPRPWGLPTLLLPETPRGTALSRPETEGILAITDLHDMLVALGGLDSGVFLERREARDRFGMDDPGIRFLGYWEVREMLTSEPAEVYVSMYTKPGKALLVVSNLGEEDVEAKVRLDFEKIGFTSGEGVAALDGATGKEVSLSDGVLGLALGKKSVRWIILEKPR